MNLISPLIKVFSVLTISCIAINAQATTFTVTNTLDDRAYDDFGNWTGGFVEGSYRWALKELQTAGAGDHKIEFNIPGEGPHIISPNCAIGTDYPKITTTVHIDGFSQPGASPGNVQIVLDDENDCSATGVAMDINEPGADGSTIQGISFVNWNKGSDGVGAINSNTTNNLTIIGNLFGIYPDGTPGPNKTGVIFTNTGGHQIGGPDPDDRNFFGHNSRTGVWMFGNSHNNVIENNWIGVDHFGNPAGNGNDGIIIRGTGNIIKDNISSNNGGDGFHAAIGSTGNYIYNNEFNNNDIHGVEFLNGDSNGNFVGVDENGDPAPNEISYNGGHGVYVGEWCDQGCQFGSPSQITIQYNSIFCNGEEGISLNGPGAAGNAAVANNTPVIDENVSGPTQIIGAGAPANSQVDLYGVDMACFDCPGGSAGQNEGKYYLGSTTADGGGNWEFSCGSGNYGVVVAMATDNSGNSTEFSEAFDHSCTSPEPEIEISGPDEICEGQNASYDVTIQDMGNNPTVEWFINGQSQGSGTSTNFSTTNLVPDVSAVTVVVTEDVIDPCFEPQVLEAEIWTTVLDGLPAPDAGDDAEICDGDTYQLGGTLADDYSSYTWTHDGAGTLTGGNTLTPTYEPAAGDVGNDVTITLEGSGNCNGETDDMVLTVNPLPEPSLTDAVICDGGAASLDAGSYDSYLWSDGSDGQFLNATTTGTYSVTVTTAAVCTAAAAADVSVSNDMAITGFEVTDVDCNGADNGELTVNHTGGQSPYTYTWNQGPDAATNSDLGPGTYDITITDVNGCSVADAADITEPDPITTNIAGTDALCAGASDGTVNLTASGGPPALSFLWSNGEVSEDLDNVPADDYSVTVTDGNGCTEVLTYTVNEPTPIEITTANTPASCNAQDGSVSINATGGTSPYTYDWNNGSQAQNLNAVGAGTYTVTVEDAQGCTEIATEAVSEQTDMASSATASDVDCNGASTGSITSTTTGGNGPYTFAWSNGADTENITDVPAGTYFLTVSDANDCSVITSATVNEPTPISADIVATDILCNGDLTGALDLTASGGSDALSFEWSTGDNSEDLTGLAAGTGYTVTVSDANGCQATATANIVEPDPLSAFVVEKTDVSEPGMSDGAGLVSGGGGTPAYSYNWENGHDAADIDGLPIGEYRFTVTDANGCEANSVLIITDFPIILTFEGPPADCFGDCNLSIDVESEGGQGAHTYLWETGETTMSISGLCAGTYALTVTDDVGQREIQSYTLTQPTEIVIDDNTTHVSCFDGDDGAIALNVNGGSPDYTYAWASGAATQNIADLEAGDYRVSVTDANGCYSTADMTVLEPDPVIVTFNPSDVLCAGGSDGDINAHVNGGNAPYTYLWSTGAETEDITGVTPGDYTLTATDALGCAVARDITIGEPLAINIESAITDVDCQGAATGALVVTVENGTAPYTYLWNTGETTQDLNGVIASDYFLTVTDNNGCTETATGTVEEPNSMTIIAATVDPSCAGESDGSAYVTIIAQNPPITTSWSNGNSEEDLINVPAGTYTLNVTDDNGCTLVETVEIEDPDPVVVVASTDNPLVCAGARGALNASARGGNAPYTYEWTHDGSMSDSTIANPTVEPTAATNYGVVAFDANGCRDVDVITLDVYPMVQVTASTNDDEICEGASTELIHVATSGNSASYAYNWSTGGATLGDGATLDVTPDSTQTYQVTVTDACGQTAVDSVEIIVHPIPEPILEVNQDTACDYIDLVLTNLGPEMSGADCQWVYGDGTTSSIGCHEDNTHRYYAEGKYDVQLQMTSPAGCSKDTNVVMNVVFPPRPEALFTADPMVQTVPQSTVNFENLSIENYINTWSMGDGTIITDELNPTHSYDSLNPGYYDVTLAVESRYGCEDSYTETVQIRGTYGVYIPNAFSPNNDSKNEFFLPSTFGLNEMEFLIYDRWGELIFHGQHELDFWDGNMQDGTPAKQDVYTWKLLAESEWADHTIEQIGKVTLLR